jgi:hypothetical protein
MSHFLHTADLGKLPSDLVRLKGQDNFVRWKRDFKVVAISEGVLDIIEGREPILFPPREDDYLSDDTPVPTDQPIDVKTETTSPGLRLTVAQYAQLAVADLEGLLVARNISYEKKEDNKPVQTKQALANMLVEWEDNHPPAQTAPSPTALTRSRESLSD